VRFQVADGACSQAAGIHWGYDQSHPCAWPAPPNSRPADTVLRRAATAAPATQLTRDQQIGAVRGRRGMPFAAAKAGNSVAVLPAKAAALGR
jgi:hypothetical protein